MTTEKRRKKKARINAAIASDEEDLYLIMACMKMGRSHEEPAWSRLTLSSNEKLYAEPRDGSSRD
jgi:formiminotetrahydrofolate cyclodeaminase